MLEREATIRAVEDTIAAALDGAGDALLIEGHAGIGKTRLHEAALDAARVRGFHVLRAAGAELETEIAFGVAGQLLNAQLQQVSPDARRDLLAHAPAQVRALAGLTLPSVAEPASHVELVHALFALLTSTEQHGLQPKLIAIDDLHWSDVASLEFLLYLLHRLEELPIAIVLTRRLALGAASSAELERIATHPRVQVHTLSALSSDSVGHLAREMLGESAEEAVVEACREAASGNPFYVHELLLALREERQLSVDELASRARALAPPAVTRILRVRVGRVGADAAALARAVAVLGDDAPLRHAAELADLDLERAAAAADALAAVEILLAREPLRFVHPLVRHAIAGDIAPAERATRHLEAARLLARDGADPERVAAHLMAGRPEGDPWVVEQLRAAGRAAHGRGAPQSAAHYLSRAVQEPPDEETRAGVLAELGLAEAEAGMPRAALHLEQAIASTADPLKRAELALGRARALDAHGCHAEAAAAYDAGLATLRATPRTARARELHDALQTGFIAASTLLPDRYDPAAERFAASSAGGGPAPGTRHPRRILAAAAVHAGRAGRPAAETLELADRAWDSGALLGRDGAEGAAWSLVTSALCCAGALERGGQVLGEVMAAAADRSSPHAFATASYFRGAIGLSMGNVTAARSDLELAREARRCGWGQFIRGADAYHALCLLHAGEPERAHEVLVATEPLSQPRDLEDAVRLLVRAELYLLQGRAHDALDDALTCGRLAAPSIRVLGLLSWRTTGALAALALGDRGQALALAGEEYELAERVNAPHQKIRAHRVLGLCESGTRQAELLRSAVALADAAPPRLDSISALIDLGALLRRMNRRADARAPLQRAVDLALSGGAHLLHERARTELTATGARPRRLRMLSGVDALTPSERRIAELAATGKSNREISQALFVTPKTVEYHLRNTYRKLDISGRHELGQVLGD